MIMKNKYTLDRKFPETFDQIYLAYFGNVRSSYINTGLKFIDEDYWSKTPFE